jgi:hypothetical protein
MPFCVSSLVAPVILAEMPQPHPAQHVRRLGEWDVFIADNLDTVPPRIAEIEKPAGQDGNASLRQRGADGCGRHRTLIQQPSLGASQAFARDRLCHGGELPLHARCRGTLAGDPSARPQGAAEYDQRVGRRTVRGSAMRAA